MHVEVVEWGSAAVGCSTEEAPARAEHKPHPPNHSLSPRYQLPVDRSPPHQPLSSCRQANDRHHPECCCPPWREHAIPPRELPYLSRPHHHTLSADRPMTDTMPEGCASAAACMLSPRSFTSRTPSSNPMAPASRGGGAGRVGGKQAGGQLSKPNARLGPGASAPHAAHRHNQAAQAATLHVPPPPFRTPLHHSLTAM